MRFGHRRRRAIAGKMTNPSPKESSMAGRNFLFVPGPTNVPDRVTRAMMVAMEDHRSPIFPELSRACLNGLKPIFKTATGAIIIFPSSGTGCWEAALTNCLNAGDKVLASRFGQFSHLWIDMCQRLGYEVEILETPWGEGAPVDRYLAALSADKQHKIKAVLVCQNETATGVTSDVAAMRQAMDTVKHPAFLFVDSVSALASIDFRMDEWGVDVCVSGSQKGLMLPAGLGVTCVSQRALAAAKSATSKRCYFDYADMVQANASGYFPYTPSLPMLYGLRESLAIMAEEGLENIFQRHAYLAGGTRAAVFEGWKLKLCAVAPKWRFQPLQPRTRRGALQGRGQAVPHRPFGRSERAHAAGRHRGRRDGHARRRSQDRAGKRRCGRAKLLAQACRAVEADGGSGRQSRVSYKGVFLDRASLKAKVRKPKDASEYVEHQKTSVDEIVPRLKGAAVAIVNKVPMREATLAQLPELKMIAVAATGYDVIDIAYCKSRGIAVANIRNYAVHTVPEHAFMLILALRRNLLAYRQDVENGVWNKSDQFCFFTHEIGDLHGSTLGIIGEGAIGQATAAIGRAFGMRVLFADHAPPKMEGVTFTPHEQVLAESDVISLHCPLMPATRNLIDLAAFKKMKRNALLINTARGGLVDEAALIQALDQGLIAGAGFDVLTVEPPKDGHPLLDVRRPNFILTPHIAWASDGAMQFLADQLIDNIDLWAAGKPQHLVT
jgi:glycerate dehydrogenase